LAYTYSKALGEGYGRNEGGGATQNTYQNPRNRAAEKQRYGFDFRHSAVVNFLYELPAPGLLGKGGAKYFFGGWQTNGIVTLRSGLPFTVSQNNTINTGETPVRPDRLSSGKLDNPTINKWFDPDAFRVVTCSQTGRRRECAQPVSDAVLSLRRRRTSDSGRAGVQERGLLADQKHSDPREIAVAVPRRDFQHLQHAAIRCAERHA
jgi:hypothetical protein